MNLHNGIFEEKLKEILYPTSKEEKIIKLVCSRFDVTRDDIIGESRTQEILEARKLVMYLMKKNIFNISDKYIGEYLGGRDRSTVYISNRKFADSLRYYKNTQAIILDIEQELI